MSTVETSVLICTRNRAAKLVGTLNSLLAARPTNGWEVIVVDNGSSDGTAAALLSYSSRLPLRTFTEPRPGVSRARNAALAAARGRFLMMTDDDCLVASDWLEVGTSLLRADPLRLIGGRVELHDPADLPLSIKTITEQQRLNEVGSVLGFMHGANLAFGREVVDQIGSFDVRLGPGSTLVSAEDTDFMYRAWRANIPVFYEPKLLVHHNHGRRGLETWYQEVGQYAFGFGAMTLKHALAGDRTLLKAIYWDMRSTMRQVYLDRSQWRLIIAKFSGLVGMQRYWKVRNLPDS